MIEKNQKQTKTTKTNLHIILGMPERIKPRFQWIKGVALWCLINPWLYFKLFLWLGSSQCRFSYFQYRQNSWCSFGLSRLSAFLFHRTSYHETLYFCHTPVKTEKQFTEQSESFYFKECWVCALRMPQAPTASVLLPATLPAYSLPPAHAFTLRQVVPSTPTFKEGQNI